MKTAIKIQFIILILAHTSIFAQTSNTRILKIDEIFNLAEQNSRQLAISRDGIKISEHQTAIAKSGRLPEISVGVDAEYLSNAVILNPNFSHNETVPVPHFGNNFSLAASQTLFQGFTVKNTIAKAKLQEQLSALNYDQDKETIKMLLLGRYLDLYKLFNQQKVYQKNIQLAKLRLSNITFLNKEGMVTKNDILRSQLQISDLDVLADEVSSNIDIINKELTVVLGLPADTRIAVDTTLLQNKLPESTYDDDLKTAYRLRPSVKANAINEKISDKNISLAKAAKLPTLTLFAGDALSRPYLYVLPPQDIYFNLYQAGIKLQYNISSLYHAKEHIQLAQTERSRQQKQSEWVEQQAEIEVNTAFVKYNEAKNELTRRDKSRQLANDNYRIVEKKYLNQLALLTDILDASTAKLSAELNQTNAQINIIYQWYQLQKATGNF